MADPWVTCLNFSKFLASVPLPFSDPEIIFCDSLGKSSVLQHSGLLVLELLSFYGLPAHSHTRVLDLVIITGHFDFSMSQFHACHPLTMAPTLSGLFLLTI